VYIQENKCNDICNFVSSINMSFSIEFQVKSLRKDVNALSSGVVIEKVEDVVIESVEDAVNPEMANQPECDNLNRENVN
jgi:hypothetical protein